MIDNLMQERAVFLLGKSKSALARLVIPQEQVVTLPESALGLTGFPFASCFSTHHQGSAPTIWR